MSLQSVVKAVAILGHKVVQIIFMKTVPSVDMGCIDESEMGNLGSYGKGRWLLMKVA